MECVKFNLFGRVAHFKNPENNNEVEFTFNNIHKPALLGILGAILGLDGRNKIKENGYLEFYEKLKKIKVSIVPKKIIFDKFIEEINNSSGLANNGMSQQVKKQCLNNPSWDIYILKNDLELELWNLLVTNLINGTSKFNISLGRKKYVANIKNVEYLDIPRKEVDFVKCDSLISEKVIYNISSELYNPNSIEFKLVEKLPVSLNKLTLYEKEKFIFTSYKLIINDTKNMFNIQNKYLYFF